MMLEAYLKKLGESDLKKHLSKYNNNNVVIYDTEKERKRGLLRFVEPPKEKVFLFKYPDEKIRVFHTIGMTFPINIFFFNKDGNQLCSYKNVPPGIKYISSKQPSMYVIEEKL